MTTLAIIAARFAIIAAQMPAARSFAGSAASTAAMATTGCDPMTFDHILANLNHVFAIAVSGGTAALIVGFIVGFVALGICALRHFAACNFRESDE